MMSLYRELSPDTMLDDEDPLKIGDPLLTLVQEDWDVFSRRLIEARQAEALLEELANFNWDDDSGEAPFSTTDLYTRRVSWSHETLEEVFGAVVNEIDEDPSDPEIPARLADVLGENLATLDRRINRGTVFYRGRPGCLPTGEPYEGTAIGAPPVGTGSPGRANRAGVSVLYAAKNETTVVAELGAKTPSGPLSVCRLRPVRDLDVIDIVRGRPPINPFVTSEEKLGWEVEIAELLGLFGYELSKPARSDDDPQEYRVTQQLCDAVRTAGYDGILYPSTRRARGVNLVVFDSSLCRIGRSWLFNP